MSIGNWWQHRSGFAKTVVALAVAFCVGVGLCALDFQLAAHGIGKSKEEFGVGPLDGISMVIMILSALALVVVLLGWLITVLFLKVREK